MRRKRHLGGGQIIRVISKFAALFLLFLAGLSLSHAEKKPLAPAQAVEEALRDSKIQTELPCITDRTTNPTCKDFVPEPPPEGLKSFLEAIVAFFKVAGPILKILFYAALILLLGYALYYLFDHFEWKDGAPRKKLKAVKKDIHRATTIAKPTPYTVPTLQDADQMAATGNFADAVHFLLLASLDAMQSKLRGLLNISATSREIIQNDILSPQDRDLLFPLVTQVERSLFAGEATEQTDYDLCRDKFLQLTEGRTL
ncbi:hypothetical protein [Paremcibacter congregatus]|uniref:hypothetical protein n=1 Tax=Paremcibacter congregatus TaxID=2043170 RepID=UPI0010549ECD|nr:hypothetical protein [Paremcibacter congregatus]QDE27232.1 hypothetical protein FIV45_08025 [Paremcibacter congregatus]